jgi:hypothetical protein
LLNIPQKVQDAKCAIIHFGLQIHLSKEIPQIKYTNIQGPCKSLKTIWLLAFCLGTKVKTDGEQYQLYIVHVSTYLTRRGCMLHPPTSVQTAMEKKAHTH